MSNMAKDMCQEAGILHKVNHSLHATDAAIALFQSNVPEHISQKSTDHQPTECFIHVRSYESVSTQVMLGLQCQVHTRLRWSGHMHFKATGRNAVAQPSSDLQLSKEGFNPFRVLYCQCLIFFGVLKYYLTAVYGTFVHFYCIAMSLWFPSDAI